MHTRFFFLQAKHILTLLFLVLSFQAKADSTDVAKSRLELVFNISNTISRFTANGAVQPVFEEPFLFGFKITDRKKKSALRVGVNFSVSNITEDLSGVSRTSTINSWAPLIGYEFRRDLGYNFEFYGGIDARYYNELNKTESITAGTPSTTTTFKTTQTGSGFGPFFGIVFHLTPHISLLTEGNLYANFIRQKREFSVSGGSTEVFEDRLISSLSPMAPSALFIVVRF